MVVATIIERGLKAGSPTMVSVRVRFVDVALGIDTTDEHFGDNLTPNLLARWVRKRIEELTGAKDAESVLKAAFAVGEEVTPEGPPREDIDRRAFDVAVSRASQAKLYAGLEIVDAALAQSLADEAKALFRPEYL